MYTFVNLLLRHLLISLIFIIGILASSAVYLSFYLEAKTNATDEIITHHSQSYASDHANRQVDQSTSSSTESTALHASSTNLSLTHSSSSNGLTQQQYLFKNLPLFISFKYLNITTTLVKTDTLKFQQANKVNNFSSNISLASINNLPSISQPFLDIIFKDYAPIKEGKTILPNVGLLLTYQLDHSNEFALFNAFSVIITIATLCIAIVSLFSRLITRKTRFNKLDSLISSAIDNIGGQADKDFAHKYKLMTSSLPKTSQVLQLLEVQFNTSVTASSALESQAYFDPVTKLENRNRFVQFYTEQINNGKSVEFGTLIIVRCFALQTINQDSGYQEGDKYVCKVTELIKKSLLSVTDAKTFRLNSSDFAIILPNITQKSATDLAQKLTVSFNEYQQSTELEAIAYSGIASFTKEQPLGELLALTDTSISIAQTKQINSWHCQTEDEILSGGTANLGNLNWRDEITSVINEQRIKLLVQPIKPSSKNKRVYNEILSRFISKSGDVLPTASFFAMAEKLDKISLIDRIIVEKTIEQIIHKSLHDQYYGINISARTMQDEQFIVWLERRLLRDPTVAAKLIFEISEKGLQQNITNSKRFIVMIHRVGARITVERFGVGLTSFKLFRDLKPDFIKMDSSYTRDIDEDKNNQYFLRLMIDLAHRLSIIVLAESVESQNERFMLEKLFVDGCQGFYVGKPEPL